jgi:cell division protein ZapE
MGNEFLALLSSKAITLDAAQMAVAERLKLLQQALVVYLKAKPGKLLGIVPTGRKMVPPRGLYIYGDVGRGKSMLMDMFFESVAIKKKRRVHFHAFMLEVHAELHHWRQEHKHKHTGKDSHDPIPPLAKKIAGACQLLCFDELQVSDIADAMILGRLFKELFKRGVVMVATSNRHPDALYLDGLQRESFLECIELLKRTLQVMELAANQDYRLGRHNALTTTYYAPLGEQADHFIQDSFAVVTHNAFPQRQMLKLQGRTLEVPYAAGNCALFSFNDLCAKPLGAADYEALCAHFDTIIIAGIPVLTPDKRNEAKRFVILIDTLYEHHVILLCSAEATPHQLYPEGMGAFEFNRTVSRLMEMQSEDYMQQKRLE